MLIIENFSIYNTIAH